MPASARATTTTETQHPPISPASASNLWTSDDADKLTAISQGTTAVGYRYDALGRRIRKEIDDNGTITTVDFARAGQQTVVEFANGPLAETKSYVLGLGLDRPVSMTVWTGSAAGTYTYGHNSLGSVTALSDSSGALVESYSYKPYGNETIRDSGGNVVSESLVGNPYRFTGRRKDFEEGLGLYNYRNRYYRPEIGRFVSSDPIGHWGDPGQLGLGQGYCGNNPVNFVDPFGLDPVPPLSPPMPQLPTPAPPSIRPGPGHIPSNGDATRELGEWIFGGLYRGGKALVTGLYEGLRQGCGYVVDGWNESDITYKVILVVGGLAIVIDTASDVVAIVKGPVKWVLREGAEAVAKGTKVLFSTPAKACGGAARSVMDFDLIEAELKKHLGRELGVDELAALERLKKSTPTVSPHPEKKFDCFGMERGSEGLEKLSKSQQKAVKSLQEQIEKHEKKLAEYLANPDAFDNLGLLKNAPSPEVRQRIIEGRARHLAHEIATFQKQIDELLGGC